MKATKEKKKRVILKWDRWLDVYINIKWNVLRRKIRCYPTTLPHKYHWTDLGLSLNAKTKNKEKLSFGLKKKTKNITKERRKREEEERPSTIFNWKFFTYNCFFLLFVFRKKISVMQIIFRKEGYLFFDFTTFFFNSKIFFFIKQSYF